jgi:hypothetical protein
VPTTAVGCPVTGTVTGGGPVSSLPAATLVEQAALNAEAGRWDALEEQPPRTITTPADAIATRRR